MTLAIGTEKGAFFLDLDDPGSAAPTFPGWKVTAFGVTSSGDRLVAVGSNWFGAALHRSSDGVEWEQIVPGPTYGSERPVSQIWTLTTAGGRVYAGVAEAGLFTSGDDAATWESAESLNEHPTRPSWEPGLGGLAAHRVLVDGDRIWCGISAVGLWRSEDAGRTWATKNAGVRRAFETDEPNDISFCIHGLTQDPANPDHMWRQEHTGVFRSIDGGDSWEACETGLPAVFGFPMVRDHASGRLFIVPLHSDEQRLPVDGRFGVWQSDDDGDTWKPSGSGWPTEPSYDTVLRGAMVGDGNGRLALGTTGGAVWLTEDAGDSWRRLPVRTPRILSVAFLPD